MLRYLLRRLCYSILVFWGVATIVFLLFNVLPNNRTQPSSGEPSAHASIEDSRRALRLDKPLWTRYAFYLNDLSPIGVTSTGKTAQAPQGLRITRLDGQNYLSLKAPYLGRSYATKHSVSALLWQALRGTAILGLLALLLAIIFGLGLGVLGALKKRTVWDTGVIATYLACISLPTFIAGLAIACALGYLLLGQLGISMGGNDYYFDPLGAKQSGISNLIFPAIALAMRPMAIIAQLTRAALIDVLEQDYIRTAYAKGFGKGRVLLRHALPNALSPVARATRNWLAELIAGAFFVEYIFGWNGIGEITVKALNDLDIPVVKGAVLQTALIFILVKLLADVLYAALNPRARLA
jgi:peptide/nickel transport system permease protein